MSDCLSRDPYCARNPAPYGSYEAYVGALCGECEDAVAREHEEILCARLCDVDDPTCAVDGECRCTVHHKALVTA